MKKAIIILAVFLVLVSVYFVLDRKLFLYGRNDLNIYSSLPLKIKPEFRRDFEGGFELIDGGIRNVTGFDNVFYDMHGTNARNYLNYGK